MDGAAVQACLELLIRGQRGHVDHVVRARGAVGAIASCAGYGAGDETAIVSPVHPEPGSVLPRLILHMGCLVERLIVVDSENIPHALALGRDANTAELGA